MAGAACHENFGSMLLQFILHTCSSILIPVLWFCKACNFVLELCILSPEKDDKLETETCK